MLKDSPSSCAVRGDVADKPKAKAAHITFRVIMHPFYHVSSARQAGNTNSAQHFPVTGHQKPTRTPRATPDDDSGENRGPRRVRNAATAPALLTDAVVVGTKRTGLEPATSAVTGLRSNQTELPLLCRLLSPPFRFPVRVGCGGIIQIFSRHCKLFLQKKAKKGQKNAISG